MQLKVDKISIDLSQYKRKLPLLCYISRYSNQNFTNVVLAVTSEYPIVLHIVSNLFEFSCFNKHTGILEILVGTDYFVGLQKYA